MDLTKRVLRVVAITIAIPAIGYAVSWWIIHAENAKLAEADLPPYEEICANLAALELADVHAACQEFASIATLQKASLAAAAAPLGLLGLYFLCSAVAGSRRSILAAMFPTLITLSLMMIAIIILLQGGVFVYAAYLGESYAIGRVHVFLIGAVGLGAFAAAIKCLLNLLVLRMGWVHAAGKGGDRWHRRHAGSRPRMPTRSWRIGA
jgi:hypothetical protein